MKYICISMSLLFSILSVSSKSYGQTEFPILVGPYLGQEPPSSVPKPFAPGVVSTEGYEYNGVFTPNMEEFYFIKANKGTRKQNFISYKKKANRWYGEVMSPRLGQPTISPDGKTMHLGRRYLERTIDGWSERKVLDAPFAELLIMRMTSSQNGTYYFDTFDRENVSVPIRASRIIDGKYEVPKPLGKNINTGTFLNHPFIAHDESYLIWDAQRDEGYGDSDLYISYKQKDGSWGEAINLGDKINSDGWDGAGYVTPDGKYFFFNRTVKPSVGDELPNVDIFWVAASFIETLRPKN